MRILVTNDDGIDATGLHVLTRAVAEIPGGHEVVVVAPDREFSGAGASVGTLHLMQPEVHRVCEHQLPADAVWRVLTNLDEYGEWNPQIPRASGAIQERRKIALRLALPGRPAMDLVATIEESSRALLSLRSHTGATPGRRRARQRPLAATMRCRRQDESWSRRGRSGRVRRTRRSPVCLRTSQRS